MPESIEFLLTLTSARVDKSEKALERNWIALIILAGIGLAFSFDLGGVPQAVAKYFGQGEYNRSLPPMITAPILLYCWTRFGHLLISFIRARTLHDKLWRKYLGMKFDKTEFNPLHQTSSFFEVFYSMHFDWFTVSFSIAVMSMVISLAQATTLFLIWKAYGYTQWSITLLSGYKSNRINWLEIEGCGSLESMS